MSLCNNSNHFNLTSGSQASEPSSGSLASPPSSGSLASSPSSGSLVSTPSSGNQVSVPTSGSQASVSTSSSVPSSGSQASSRRPKCDICSNKEVMGYVTKDVYHEHYSSRYLQECSSLKGESSFDCLPCKLSHPNEISSSVRRLKICVSSSMLHKFWETDNQSLVYEGNSTHIDWLTIKDARINQLTAAWEVMYLEETRPMDVFFMGGIEDIIRGRMGPSIIKALKYFVELVEWQGRKHPEEPNTCAISTLYYPPKLCWLDDDKLMPSNFDNQLRNIRWLNQKIEELNAKSGIKVPKVPCFGVRKLTRHGRSTTRHRMEHWKEENRDEKLHLTDDQRMKLGRQVVRHLLHNTGN